MKPYGNSRRDNLKCEYECCHGDRINGSRYSTPKGVRRASKKRARSQWKQLVRSFV